MDNKDLAFKRSHIVSIYSLESDGKEINSSKDYVEKLFEVV